MLEIANQLVRSLFKKNSLQECSRWELEILADKYPYFGIAQLLVSGKLKQEKEADFEKQVQKTSLYFTNPLWLDYVLNRQPQSPAAAPATNGDAHTQTPVVTEQSTADEVKQTAESTVTSFENDVEEPVAGQSKEEVALNQTRDENIIGEPETGAGTAVTETSENIAVAQTHEIIDPVAANEVPAKAVAAEPVNSNIAPGREMKEDIPVPEPGEENKQAEIHIAPFKQEPLPDMNTPLTFEPYHTVDYFASQGIKLSQEEKPKDRFGQQLKSFTQWLKAIKNTPPAEIAKELGKGNDQKVITLAEHSLDDREIVTEAMAEVWIKQGKTQKAIDVYDKLSLQNPAKSAYFASLIEQLKQH